MVALSGVNAFSIEQLNTIFDSLFHEARVKKNVEAKLKLIAFFHELCHHKEFAHTQTHAKAAVMIAYLEGSSQQVLRLIENGSFPRDSFNLLRSLYKELVAPNSKLIKFPASIDPLDGSGIAESLSEHLYTEYVTRKQKKTALDIAGVARETGLPERFVMRRFQLHRDALRKETKKEDRRQKRQESARLRSQQLGPFYYMVEGAVYNQPTRDMFPLHRVPLDQPLSIIIP